VQRRISRAIDEHPGHTSLWIKTSSCHRKHWLKAVPNERGYPTINIGPLNLAAKKIGQLWKTFAAQFLVGFYVKCWIYGRWPNSGSDQLLRHRVQSRRAFQARADLLSDRFSAKGGSETDD
jgi:hypothetical protein